LKRVELADKLQGLDYIYTINGWLKSINNPNMGVIANDPGSDDPTTNQFGRDVFAMSLDYYSGDYTRTGKNIVSSPLTAAESQYGGNIYAQRWNTNKKDINNDNNPTAEHYMYKYEYTNENWLGRATYGKYNTSFNAQNDYKVYGASSTELISYDANGNIIKMSQNGYSAQGLPMDKLTYNYIPGKNQLAYITDVAVSPEKYNNDISNQSSSPVNYSYDATGRMTINSQDGHYFTYDVYGNVTKVSSATDILAEYFYDDKGFRICKIDRRNTALPDKITWYVRDINGNILSTYSEDENVAGSLARSEVYLYGSSRLGTAQVVSGATTKYLYELSDHLGNIRAVVTADGSDQNDLPDLAGISSYYPFGMPMESTEHNYVSALLNGSYRFGYQGQFAEKDPETGYNQFEARLYDSRIGRWMIPDPLKVNWSFYLGMGNNPVNFIDPDGMKELPKNFIGPPNIDDWYAPDRWANNDLFKFASTIFFESTASSAYIDEFWFKLSLRVFLANNPNRPDADMFLTFDEATLWSNIGQGRPLFVDARKINLKPLKVPDVINAKYHNSGFYDFFDDLKGDYNTGRVYGNLKITLLDPYEGKVRLGLKGNLLDIHDFRPGPAKVIDDLMYKGEANDYNIYCIPCTSKVPVK
ncbi:MAG: RHS repeat-associated core domain-containing protein, partial [Bacteroidales bacterium]|nr:RHS repeat-associated core domain-containing protein [Bacteroidales bacterium]